MNVELNEKQLKAVTLARKGKNVLLTGAAGCGKSYTISTIVADLRGQRKRVAVTASTGAAALLIGGRTLHSFLGIGLAKQPAEKLAQGCLPAVATKLRRLDTLVIDEISMVSAELLDKVNVYLQIVRGKNTPFGGVQVILTGDLFQLPPVEGDYCFLSKIWKTADFQKVELTRVYRQQQADFLELLQRARIGSLTDDDVEVLRACSKCKLDTPELAPTRLFSTNANVDLINNKELQKLIDEGAESRIYKAQYSDPNVQKWAASVGVRDSLTLCKGAQVMLTRNINLDEGLVNGSRGVVIGFEAGGPVVQFEQTKLVVEPYITRPDDEVNSKQQPPTTFVSHIPLILAWAITINKAQGCTLDAVEMDLGSTIFAHGQAYTALSRARSLEGIQITDVARSSFKTDPRVLELFRQ